METHNLLQRSEEWHKFRREHANASESPCILGCSPWLPKTWRQLAEVKLGVVEIKQTAIMRAGAEAEGRISELYEQTNGEIGNDMCISEGIFAASLDWTNMDLTRIAEYKTPAKGSKSPMFAKEEIKDNVYAQVQHQLMVSNADECDLVVYANDIDEITVVPIVPDIEFQNNLREKWEEFWSYYSEGKLPPAQKGDVIDLSHDEGMVAMAQNYHLARKELDQAKAKENQLRQQLIDNAFDRSIRVNGVTVERIVRKGAVDWKALQHDQQLHDSLIDRFRKPSTVYHRIREA